MLPGFSGEQPISRSQLLGLPGCGTRQPRRRFRRRGCQFRRAGCQASANQAVAPAIQDHCAEVGRLCLRGVGEESCDRGASGGCEAFAANRRHRVRTQCHEETHTRRQSPWVSYSMPTSIAGIMRDIPASQRRSPGIPVHAPQRQGQEWHRLNERNRETKLQSSTSRATRATFDSALCPCSATPL
jgi:hypothetical protein